ncbi:MAG: VOC family protein, partial [Chloroflexota bacterium]
MAHGEFTHFDIPTDDMDRGRTFYETLFGWKATSIEGFPDYEMMQPGPARIGAGLGVRGKTAPDRPRIYVDVDSIDEALAKLPGVGGAVAVA